MQKKNPAKRRPERLVVTLLSLLFLSTAVFATVKYVFRAPELDTDKPVVTPDGTASTDVDRTDTDEPDAPGRTRREYCYNILVSGLDDDNGGSDTNILVRFDVPNKRIDLVSLPRDTLLHNEYRNNKLNFAYAKGGTELLMEQIENLLGIPVDFYVTVNLKGFIALVDQIDGVDFDIPINMDYDDPYQDLHIHFTKGPRHLNGQEAMEVVRFRHNNDGTGYGTEDIGRIGTQQAFLKAVAKQLLQIGNVKNIPAGGYFLHLRQDRPHDRQPRLARQRGAEHRHRKHPLCHPPRRRLRLLQQAVGLCARRAGDLRPGQRGPQSL